MIGTGIIHTVRNISTFEVLFRKQKKKKAIPANQARYCCITYICVH